MLVRHFQCGAGCIVVDAHGPVFIKILVDNAVVVEIVPGHKAGADSIDRVEQAVEHHLAQLPAGNSMFTRGNLNNFGCCRFLDKHGDGVPSILFGDIERFVSIVNDALRARDIVIFSNDAQSNADRKFDQIVIINKYLSR